MLRQRRMPYVQMKVTVTEKLSLSLKGLRRFNTPWTHQDCESLLDLAKLAIPTNLSLTT